MPGIFSKSNRPKRPGSYVDFVADQPQPTLINAEGIVALPIVHSWGPSEQVVELNSFGDFLSYFGQGGTVDPVFTPGYKAVRQAFLGEGLPARGGAGQVLAYRMTGSSAAKANRSLQNVTPAAAITLTAVYEGSYGNRLTVAVVPNAKNPTVNYDLVLYDNGVEIERFTFAKANVQDLADQINGTGAHSPLNASKWVTASAVTTGTALSTVSTPAALSGGDDGATVASADWTAALTALEPYRFGVFAPYDLTDSSILASLLAWEQNLNSKGKRFELVVGGAAGEDAATAVARSQSLADPNVANLGIGTYTDADLGDLSTSQLAPRIAGIIAAKGERSGLTFARLAGLTIKVGASEADIEAAIDGGVIAIARDSNQVAPTRLEKGISTFTSKTDAQRPFGVYSVVKFVRVMHGIERDVTEFAEAKVIGQLPVNPATRDYVRTQMEQLMREREAEGVVQPGWSVRIDNDPPPAETDDFIPLVYEVAFERDAEQVLNTIVVR